MTKVVIIGGVAAGPKAAAKLRRIDKDIEIEIYTQENEVSYSACGLPYYIKGLIPDIDNLVVRRVKDFEEQNIKVFTHHKCIKILPGIKEIILQNLENNEFFHRSYDKLLIATGAKPYIPVLEKSDNNNIFVLRTLQDGIKIKNIMKNSKSVTIIGGGYISIELLEAFVENNLKINLITDAPYLMNSFDEDISKIIQDEVLKNSNNLIKIYNNDRAIAINSNNNKKEVKTEKGEIITSDFVVICTGVQPNSELAIDARIKTGMFNAIKVNKYMQTSCSDIYAAGDCCEKHCYISHQNCYVALGSIANKEGRVAAINIAGGEEFFPGVLLSTVTKFFDYTIAMAGFTEKMAMDRGYTPISATISKKDKAGYMPESKEITIKLVVDKISREILGAQAVGYGDADKRINVIVTALTARLKLDALLNLDLTYSPPYSTSIDTLNVLAMKIQEKLNKIL